MQTSSPKKNGRMTTAAGAAAVALVVIFAMGASAKKKEKTYLPDYVLKAQTILVVILPDSGEPMNDPYANRHAQQDVEKALMKWGRYRIALDADTADLVIGIRKGTGQTASPTIHGGPVDTDRRPGTIETTDNQIRIGVQQGQPPSTTQEGDASTSGGQPASTDRTHPGMQVGSENDAFLVFHGNVQYPLDYAPVWKHIAKDGLKAPGVTAVEQFRKAVEESEKAAALKQQQKQPPPATQPQQKDP